MEDQPETSRNATDISEEECQQGGEDHNNMFQSCLKAEASVVFLAHIKMNVGSKKPG